MRAVVVPPPAHRGIKLRFIDQAALAELQEARLDQPGRAERPAADLWRGDDVVLVELRRRPGGDHCGRDGGAKVLRGGGGVGGGTGRAYVVGADALNDLPVRPGGCAMTAPCWSAPRLQHRVANENRGQ